MSAYKPPNLDRGKHGESCQLRTITAEARRVVLAQRETVIKRKTLVWLCGPDCKVAEGQLAFWTEP